MRCVGDRNENVLDVEPNCAFDGDAQKQRAPSTRTLGVIGRTFVKHQRGFLDWALLHVAEKARWYIRYPVAVCVLFAAWWLLQRDLFFIPLILLACAAVLGKEVSPTLLLMVAAMWVWPSGFLDIPFAQMTFGILGQFLLSCMLFVFSIIMGLRAYAAQQRAPEGR